MAQSFYSLKRLASMHTEDIKTRPEKPSDLILLLFPNSSVVFPFLQANNAKQFEKKMQRRKYKIYGLLKNNGQEMF